MPADPQQLTPSEPDPWEVTRSGRLVRPLPVSCLPEDGPDVFIGPCEINSVRYANKASAAGSPVTLQTWNHMVHVWHIFNPELTEARQAFDEIGRFLNLHAPRN